MPDPNSSPILSPAGRDFTGAFAPPNVPTAAVSNDNAPQFDNSGALAGLSGGVPVSFQQPTAPTAQETDPTQNISRGVMAALSGGSGHPMDWARATLSGVLSGAANVGKAPEGGGFLYGLARGAAGQQAIVRQNRLDQQARQQQQFENQLKTNQDTRAQKELEIHAADSKAQIAMWNANEARAIHEDQRAQALFQYQTAENQETIRKLMVARQQEAIDLTAQIKKAVPGISNEELENDVTSFEQMSDGQKQGVFNATTLAIHNGEEAKPGEDNYGHSLLTNFGQHMNTPMPSDGKALAGYNFDKNGNPVPQYQPYSKGTPLSTILGLAAAAEKSRVEKLAQLNDQAKLAHEQASTRHENAETNEANARAALVGKPNDPVYATFQDAQGQSHTVLTTKGEATQKGYGAIRPVKESDISKDQHDIKVLNDIQVKADNVTKAASVMDNTSWRDSAAIAKYLADNPNTTVNTLLKSKVFGQASPQAQAYAIAINSLRESSMGLQKVLTGSARNNETQLQALLNTLPGVEPNSKIVGDKLNAFTQNLQMLRQGLPEGTGITINTGAPRLPQAPAGQVSVQIPGQPPGFIPQNQLTAFKTKHPDAVVNQ